MSCTGFIIQMNASPTEGEWVDVDSPLLPTATSYVLQNWDGTTQRFRIKALGTLGISLDSNWGYFPIPVAPPEPPEPPEPPGPTGPDLTNVLTYVFPTGYPTAVTINSWTTEGLQMYRAEDDVLIGIVPATLAAPCPNITTYADYYEITQNVTFLLQNDNNYPEDTTFQKEITWRVPAPGKTYWQYNGSFEHLDGLETIDFNHIMNPMLPTPSVHRIKFIDNDGNQVVAPITLLIEYNPLSKTYILRETVLGGGGGTPREPFLFAPDSLHTENADEVDFVVT